SLNPSQISGGCGRLLCCLKYEHEFYVTARKRFPKEGKSLQTSLGIEKVIAVDIFRERVFLRSEEHGSRIIPLMQLREEMDRAVALLAVPDTRTRQAPPTSEPAPTVPPVQAISPTPGNGNAPASGNGHANGVHPTRRRRRRRGPGDTGGSTGSPPPVEP
ncbi:MAG TPA: hypothetical protein VFB89_15630, partial [Gemmatimonadales bacterium]|nr:hypothetical protein [Gemmatimonadales bacterium]